MCGNSGDFAVQFLNRNPKVPALVWSQVDQNSLAQSKSSSRQGGFPAREDFWAAGEVRSNR